MIRSFFATILLCLLLLCSVAGGYSQEINKVDYLGLEHGLSNNAVTCIYQDKSGFMWFGTYDGLNRYDGYTFKSYRKNLVDSLSLINNHIVTIYEDSEENLWVGTWQGLNIFERLTEKFRPVYWIDRKGKMQTIINEVSSIETGNKGQLLFAANEPGLLELEKGAVAAKLIPLQTAASPSYSYIARLIKRTPDGRIWVFVNEVGLCLYNETNKQLLLKMPSVAFANTGIVHINNNLWIATRSGLLMYNISSGESRVYTEENSGLSHSNIAGLMAAADGKLWIGTDGGGLCIMNMSSFEIRPVSSNLSAKSITSPTIYSIWQDRETRVWLGTLRGGVNIVDPQKNQFRGVARDPRNANSLINNFVLSLCEENASTVWIGTDGGGLSIWNRDQNQFQNFRHEPGNPGSISSNFITNIIKDHIGNIWISTFDGGISRYLPGSKSFKRYGFKEPKTGRVYKHAWTLCEDKDHELWVGMINGGGIFRYNAAKDEFEMFDNSFPSVICLTEDKNGQLWVGTFDGLVQFDKYAHQHKIVNLGSPVRSIHVDAKNRLWVGTEGKGLLQMNEKLQVIKSYTRANGLANDAVLRLLEDGTHRLWLGTYYGISRFDPATGAVQNFYESDGLQSNQLNYNSAIQTSRGEMIFGGINGFNVFYPDSIEPRSTMPPLQLTRLTVSNQPVHLNQEYISRHDKWKIDAIKLPYSNASISMEFAALEYSAPDKISYAYYLEGWDKGWNDAGHTRIANYTRLSEGHYKLWVKNTNAAGKWSEPTLVFEATVLPPWYRSWWAYALYLIAIVYAARLYLRYKRNQTQLEYEVKVAHVEAEKEKELNEKKLNFFTSVSHEFRTPLTLIINPVKDLLYGNNGNGNVDVTDLNIVYRNARRLLSLVDQLLLFRKADTQLDKLRVSQVVLSDLCYEVYLCFTKQASSKNLQYEFSADAAATKLYLDSEKIEIAMFNLVSNAIKYTPENGKVEVKVQCTEQGCEVLVQDNGPGISASRRGHLFEKFYQAKEIQGQTGFGIGLYVAKTFVEQHKGTLEYLPGEPAGSCFKLLLLPGREHFDANTVFEDSSSKSPILQELVVEAELPQAPEKKETRSSAATAMSELVTDERVMLVLDDHEQIRQYVTQIFKNRFKIYEAASAEEGLPLAKKYVPDIIISDVVMKEMSGIEFCSIIKNDPNLGHIPVILLTASSAADLKLKGLELGADDYITKPFEKDILVARVNNLLQARNTLQNYFFNEITLKENHIKISAEDKAFLERCVEIVQENIERDEFNIKTLASELGMSHSTLYKKIKSISGQTATSFIRFIRLRKAAELMIHSDSNVNEIAFQVGIGDPRYFRDQFNQLFGMNPSEYIKKYRKPFQKKFNLNEKAARNEE
ncbi:MAG TPA: two-component regulator propeller domain-containing protein [Phnomibacter sp.]|nr:two-component regulator propeller domain-containing protein [Phnomibacter sp.]